MIRNLPITGLFWLISFFGFSHLPLKAQHQIFMSERIDSLIQFYQNYHLHRKSMEGYRIQIATAGNRTQMNDIKALLLQHYPDLSSNVIYQAPNFKLRAGYFKDKLSATKSLEQIRIQFPDAFIIRDQIPLSFSP